MSRISAYNPSKLTGKAFNVFRMSRGVVNLDPFNCSEAKETQRNTPAERSVRIRTISSSRLPPAVGFRSSRTLSATNTAISPFDSSKSSDRGMASAMCDAIGVCGRLVIISLMRGLVGRS